MKPIFFSILCLAAPFAFADEKPATDTAPAVEESAKAGPLRHIVMVKFKEGTSAETIANIETEFGKLVKKIDTIRDYEWGLACTAERGMDQGFTHCFVVTFDDMKGLEAYLPHEAHQEFVKIFRPTIDEILVLDFVAK